MNHLFMGSKILNSIQTYRRGKEELKANWPRSYSALKKKDLKRAPYVIYPHQKEKIAWDFFVGGLILESVIVVPLRLGFHIVPQGFAVVFDVFVDICFGFDIVLTFLTTYEHEGVTIVDLRKISKHYLKSWFTIDFLSTFPFDLVIPLLVEGISPGALRSFKLVRAFRLFRLLKLFRVARLSRKIKDAKIEDIIHPVIYDLIGLFFWIFVISHILGCSFFYFSDCDSDDETNWQQCGKDDLTSKYILSMYWTVTTILSVGYGDIYLTSNKGRLFSNFVILLGSVIFGLLVSTVQSSAKNWDRQETERTGKLNQVREYIYEMKIIGSVRRQMSNHFEYFYAHKSNAWEEAVVLDMPIILGQYSLLQTKKQLMELNFFKFTSLDIVMEIIPHLNPFQTKKGDYIYHEGELCTDMFFVVNGLVEAYKKIGDKGNYLVGIYQTGSEFGIKRAMTCATVTWASFRSCDKCDLMWLSNVSIRKLMGTSHAIKYIFEEEAGRESDLIETLDETILSSTSKINNGEKVSGTFRINSVIHNNTSVINFRSTKEILQNVDLLGDAVIKIPTYKTVRIVGKMNGQDEYHYSHETTKQMWSRWVINPHCQYKLYFDSVTILMVMVSSLTVPYRMAFDIPSTFQWSVLDGISEVFFCFDLIASFFTAYEYKDGTLDTSLKIIASRYLSTWFIIDALSAVPLYRITAGGSSVGIVGRLLKTLKLGRLFRLFKVFKFARILKLLELSNHDFVPNGFIAIQNSCGLMIKMLAILGFITHMIACIFSWISIGSNGTTWASETKDIDSTFERYIAALYWTYATMSTVGYGDIVAQNDSERLFAIIIMVLGSTGLPYIVSEISNHVFDQGSGKGQQDKQLSISRDYFIQNATPQSWRDAILRQFSFLMEKQTAFDHRLIWSQMPHALRRDVMYHVSQEDFDKIPLFHSIIPSVLCAIYKYSNYCMTLKDSFMYTFETESAGLYFVLKGFAEVVDAAPDSESFKATSTNDPMVVIAPISEGMFFGQEVLTKSPFNFLGIRAKSDLYTLLITTENLALMKVEVPLVYETLLFVIEQALAMSSSEAATEMTSNDSLMEKTSNSRLMRMSQYCSEGKLLLTKSKAAQKVEKFVKKCLSWFNSDVDEAKSLYQTYGNKSVISELKAKKKILEEKNRALLPDSVSREKFLAIQSKSKELDSAPSEVLSMRSSSRRIHRSLSRVSEENSLNASKSMSKYLSDRFGDADEGEESERVGSFGLRRNKMLKVVSDIYEDFEDDDYDL